MKKNSLSINFEPEYDRFHWLYCPDMDRKQKIIIFSAFLTYCVLYVIINFNILKANSSPLINVLPDTLLGLAGAIGFERFLESVILKKFVYGYRNLKGTDALFSGLICLTLALAVLLQKYIFVGR